MTYLHVDCFIRQAPKRRAPCGDSVAVRRSPSGALVALCDGLGSGVRAHLAAQFILARFMERLEGGASLRRAFSETVATLEANRGGALPWGALTVARILPEGDAALLAYESPPPLLLNGRHVLAPAWRPLPGAPPAALEASCVLRPDDGILLVSDGLTQAGLGRRIAGMPEGWGLEGVRREAGFLLSESVRGEALPAALVRKALTLWGEAGDDCSAVLAQCRKGVTVNLFTGPPSRPDRDGVAVREFLASEGPRVVCGATTAKVVARETGRSVEVENPIPGTLAPPRSRIAGVDLVTEGVVTLNQLRNVLDADPTHLIPDDPVTELHELLALADRVRFFAGGAENPAAGAIHYRQQGLLLRREIVPLLAEKLRGMGKLVEVRET